MSTVDAPPAPRADWLDSLRNATTMALLGIVTTVAALPVVTAGAAVAAASAAVHDWCEDGALPDARVTLRRFTQALLPGLLATAVAALAAALFVVDIRALVTGVVPGGPVLLAVTAVIGVALLGLAGLAVVEVGRAGGRGWRAAARLAAGSSLARPVPVLGIGLTLVIAGLLAAFIPVTGPILAGFALFALHAIARRGFGRPS